MHFLLFVLKGEEEDLDIVSMRSCECVSSVQQKLGAADSYERAWLCVASTEESDKVCNGVTCS